MRLALLAALACTGCFDFDTLTECTASDALVCENFETGAVRDLWFVNADGASTGTIDTSRTHAGHDALHVQDGANAGDTYLLQWTKLDSNIDSDAYIRAFFFAPTPPTNTVTLLNMIENVTPYEGLRIFYESDGTLRIHNGIAGPDASTTMTLPTARWTCIEWFIHEGNTGASTLWLDDTEVASTTGDTMPTTRLGKVSVGAGNQVALPAPFEVWIDDVVVDKQRITCHQ